MAFPLMCENWAHFPIDIPDDDPDWKILQQLGFIQGEFCEKEGSLWRHMSLPATWIYTIDSDGDMVIKDERGRSRILVVTSRPKEELNADDTQTTEPDEQALNAYMAVYRYYTLEIRRYREAGQGFIFFELNSPDGYTVYDAFVAVPLNPQFDVRPLVPLIYTMARVIYPEIADPLAYWDTSP